MHEMSICEGVVQVLEDQACVQHYSRVTTVWLEIGPLAGVELDALRFCFDAVTRNTLAEGARLEIVEAEGKAWCPQCFQSVSIRQRYDACPECDGVQLQVTGGEELRIKELEVD